MDKSIIIELMAHHYAGRISSQILIGLFGAISQEDKDYISENGYELVDRIAEAEHTNLDQEEYFDLDHISSCFEAYISSDDPRVIDYCFSLFNRFVERKWIRFRSNLLGIKSYEELEGIKPDYMAAGYYIFRRCFINAVDNGYTPQSFIAFLSRRFDGDLIRTMDHDYRFTSFESSLNDEISESDGLTLADTIADSSNNIEEFLNDNDVSDILELLSPYERNIVMLHLGLVDGIEMSYDKIASMYGTYKKKINRDYDRAIEKLRKNKDL